jgi:DNA replication protein DnaC
MTNNQATLHKLDQMRLHGMARALRTSLDTQGQWTADELLAHLVDAEWDDRHERRLKRLLKAARFRYPAAIEEVDFALRRNLDRNQLLRLADCRWVQHHQDLIITGKCGSGKSFLASALGHQACLRGFRVGYHASSRLFAELRLAKADGSYVRELEKISKQALTIIDDFALEPLDALARLALLEMLEDRHGRASTLMVSQLPVSSWHEVIGEPTIADAICDRLVHGAHRIDLEGDSVRKLYAERANRDPAEPLG